MAKKGANISLSSYDDIFSTEESRNDTQIDKQHERVQEIQISELHPFKDHPFKVIDNEEMKNMVESIIQFGVLSPAIARPDENGGFEIVAGHRRHHAAELAGLKTIPVIVRELDDDAATILMVDSNLQRENILPSERAYSFKMKLDAIDRVKGRPKNVGQVVPDYFGKRTTEIIAEGSGESYKQVQRYIRLTELIPELMEMVDNKQIAFNPAVELSYLKQEEQREFLTAMDYAQSTPSLSQAQRLKKFSQEGKCGLDAMCAIMSEEKKSDLDRITLKDDVLKKYFPKTYTPKQMEDTIIKLLDQWQKKRNREMSL